MRAGFKRGVSLGLALMLALSGSVFARAEESAAKNENLLKKADVEYIKSGELISRVDKTPQATIGSQLKSVVGALSLPSYYNSRDYGYVDRVENQALHGLCWSYTQNTLAAINVKKDEGKSVNYSEMHMAYALSSSFGNTKGFVREPNSGGNSSMSVAYLSRGSGMVADAEDPYIAIETLPYRAPSVTESYFSTGYLEASPMPGATSVTKIKELIYEYGGAGTNIYYDDYYMRNNVYYCPYKLGVNHSVTLIGWDDSRQCFLAQNSWGNSWGSNGLFWISYSDAQVREQIFATDYKSGDLPFDGIRSYNDFGWISYFYSGNGESLYYATSYETGDAKSLEGIGTYTVMPNTRVEVYLNPYDGDGKTASKFKLIHSQTFEYPGYYHLSFAKEAYLYGTKFNVKIKITSTTGGQTGVPFQQNLANFVSGSKYREKTTYYGGNDGKMWLMEEFGNAAEYRADGVLWAMHAFTKSDLSFSADQAQISFGGETYQVTLSQLSNRSYALTRNQKSLPLYTNAACTSQAGSTLAAGTYYMKLQNGTHIRRAISVSTIQFWGDMGSVQVMSGSVKNSDGSFLVILGDVATYRPTVFTTNGASTNWSFYALPNGVGKIGTTFTPTLYRTKIYLRVQAQDGYGYYEYPVEIRAATKSVSGFKDWSKVSSWAKSSMNKAVSYGLIQGDSGGNLNPLKSMSRAEAAAILLRAGGIESSKVGNEYAKGYADVVLNSWYDSSVSTASYIGMISGHSNPGYRCFSPGNTVTREQFASMAIRLLAYDAGVDSNTYINRYIGSARSYVANKNYADLAKVSVWAKDAVYVALYLGVFGGAKVNNRLYIQPQNNITREQAASMMQNTMDLIN